MTSPAAIHTATGLYAPAHSTGRRQLRGQTDPALASRRRAGLKSRLGARLGSLPEGHTTPSGVSNSVVPVADLPAQRIPFGARLTAAGDRHPLHDPRRFFSDFAPSVGSQHDHFSTHSQKPFRISVSRKPEDARKAFGNGPNETWSSTSEHR